MSTITPMTRTRRRVRRLGDDLEALVRAAELPPRQAEWMLRRWLVETLEVYEAGRRNQLRLSLSRLFSVGGSLAVPVLAGAALADTSQALQAGTLGLALVAAGGTAAEQALRLGLRVRVNRTAFADLTREGSEYVNRAGRYRGAANSDQAFADFVEVVEEIIRRREASFLGAFPDPPVEPGSDAPRQLHP